MTKQKMFLRMITASLVRRRSRMLVALLAIAVGATILSGLVTIYYDVPRQMGAQFRSYGANMIFTAAQGRDGFGMDEALLARVMSPFGTTRTTRKVGLGIPLMAQNARLTGGDIALKSEVGKGTVLTATLDGNSIDCLPLGDLAGTVVTLVTANPYSPDFLLECTSPKGSMSFDTREVRQVLGDVGLNEPEISVWMLESIREELQPIFGGVIL